MALSYDELPKPEWCVCEDDPVIVDEFPEWTEKDALTFIIGQKYSLFPTLTNLPRIDDEQEPPDLHTIERRISWDGYGPEQIMEDLNGLEDHIIGLREANKIPKGRHQYHRLLRMAKLLIKMVAEELEKFKSCSDCVAYYYNSNNYFTVPCRKLHSVVYVKKGETMWPAKTISVKDDKVLVAHFGCNGKSNFRHQQEWVRFSACVMASTCFLYDITSNRHKEALMEMGVYIQMIARKRKRYYKGFPCHGKNSSRKAVVFNPDLLVIPDELLSSQPPDAVCSYCSNGITETVTVPLIRDSNRRQLKKPKIEPVVVDVVCARDGCSNKASQKVEFSKEVRISFCSDCVNYF